MSTVDHLAVTKGLILAILLRKSKIRNKELENDERLLSSRVAAILEDCSKYFPHQTLSLFSAQSKEKYLDRQSHTKTAS
jgi:hypothetical protein